ncbi:MAG TPA: ABC transporter permease, partial [Streptosporangiaceae bacterium]|nr:ABC transporter permease [Streptosporangiaceae bacterium]
MRLSDQMRVASIGIRSRRLRAALSALGIAIGTAAIVAVLGLSASSQAGLLAEIDQLGTNL